MNRLARAIAHHPWFILAVIGVLSAPAAYYATRVRIDSSAESLIREDDPDTRYYDEVRKLFGNEEVDAVILVADDVFRAETLEKIRRLDRKLAAIPGVERVQSLASVEVVTAGAGGALAYGPVMPRELANAARIEQLRRLVHGHPILGHTFVSSDDKAAMLLIDYRKMPQSEFVQSGLVERVDEVLRDESGPEALHLIGSPSLRVAAARMMRRDLALFAPATSAIIVLVLLVAFRSLRGVILPLATVGIGLLWTVGLMGFFGARLDVIGLVLPSILLAVGSAYATHVVASFYDLADSGRSKRDVIAHVLEHLGLPVFVTAFTTLVGFASLVTYRIPAIRSFGLFSTFGVAVLFVLALTFTAGVLALLPMPRRRAASADREWPWLRRLLDAIVTFDLRHKRLLLALALLILGVFAWKIPAIELDSDFISYFAAGSPQRIAAGVVDRHFGGSVNFLVAIDGPEPGSLTRLGILRRIEALEDFIAHLPGVGDVSSPADIVKLVHRALHDDDPTKLTLPDTDNAVQQYLLLVPPDATEPFLLSDGSRAVLRVRSSIRGSRELAQTLEEIRGFAERILPRGFAVKTTGAVPLVNRTADDLASGQVQSVVLALVVVFVTMAIFFVSIRLAVVAMLPNLVPIIIYFGVLGWAGISLSISTGLIASMVLGLGVDEAIHLLSEFNLRVRQHGDQERAIREAMETVGPPVFFTAAALSLGFLAQTLSGFVPIQQFAWLSALNVFTSLLADLFLTPAFVASVRFVTLWDLLTLKLGRDPQRTIPLFDGLRPAHARIAVLMGQLRSLAVDESIVTQGELGGEMFVLLSGRAEVRARGPQGSLTVATLGRGDVIGEMGLLRGEPRSADVVAVEPSEVLVVDQRFLDVLLRRYPRIAARLLVNLSRILSGKLHATTRRLVEQIESGTDAFRRLSGVEPERRNVVLSPDAPIQ